jgi:hypothetical protein
VLNHFAGVNLSHQLAGKRIDNIENLLILEYSHHEAFGSMKLWFTEPELHPTGLQRNLL